MSDIVVEFQKVLAGIPSELSGRMKLLEKLYGETEIEELKELGREIEKTRKKFFYRRKRYRELDTDEEVSKYMVCVHEIMVSIVKWDRLMVELIGE